MEKIFDILKGKFESPFLSNFFIGLLLFNKKVIYAAFSIDYRDKINDTYCYKGEGFSNKIELLNSIFLDDSYLGLPAEANAFFLPLIYSIIVTGLLPYIKAIFKTINENADNFYDWLRIIINKIKTVPEEKFLAQLTFRFV